MLAIVTVAGAWYLYVGEDLRVEQAMVRRDTYRDTTVLALPLVEPEDIGDVARAVERTHPDSCCWGRRIGRRREALPGASSTWLA